MNCHVTSRFRTELECLSVLINDAAQGECGRRTRELSVLFVIMKLKMCNCQNMYHYEKSLGRELLNCLCKGYCN